MRYVEVTHSYVLPVPVDQEEALDAVVARGVQIMEEFIQERAQAITDLRSDWKHMPKDWIPPVTGTEIVRPPHDKEVTTTDEIEDKYGLWDDEHDVSQAASFVPEATIEHPYDHDPPLWIFPLDHPLGRLERHLKEQGDVQALNELARAQKQLPAGEGDEDG